MKERPNTLQCGHSADFNIVATCRVCMDILTGKNKRFQVELDRAWRLHNEFLNGPYHQRGTELHKLRDQLDYWNAVKKVDRSVASHMAMVDENLRLQAEVEQLKRENENLKANRPDSQEEADDLLHEAAKKRELRRVWISELDAKTALEGVNFKMQIYNHPATPNMVEFVEVRK